MQRKRKAIELEKTRDLFKKIRDTKVTFHAKIDTIKDRNGRNLVMPGRSPGTGKCSCLENFMDRGVWLPTVHGVVKSQT